MGKVSSPFISDRRKKTKMQSNEIWSCWLSTHYNKEYTGTKIPQEEENYIDLVAKGA